MINYYCQVADTALSLEHVDASFALTRRGKDVVEFRPAQ